VLLGGGEFAFVVFSVALDLELDCLWGSVNDVMLVDEVRLVGMEDVEMNVIVMESEIDKWSRRLERWGD
jgi:hypothetical protein